MRKKNLYVSLIIILLTGSFLSFADAPGKKKQIISVVKQFCKVLESRDVEVAKQVLMPTGISFSLRHEGETRTLKTSQFRDLINRMPNLKEEYKEVIHDPKVLINDGIAVVWARYEFFRDGKFSHCGVDAFSLMETLQGWKIAAVIYTVEKADCK